MNVIHSLRFVKYDSQWLFKKHLYYSRHYWCLEMRDGLKYAGILYGFCANTTLFHKKIRAHVDSRVH